MKLEKGTTISHYKILSEIGKGGMGEVYLAQDTKLNRKVAIKFLNEEFSKDSEKLNRFVQEAQSASALNHPNIITIYEIGEFEGSHFIATEFIEGETLNKYLKGKEIKFGSVLDIAIQVASALDEAHSAGIVHRDIKPDNVMVRENGLAKILDFGIAKLTGKQTPELESEDKTAIQVNTTPGMIIGTANYMSPEQAKGKEVDARTDIFSFGVVLYELIAGHLPFAGETPMEAISSIIKDEPKPLSPSIVPPEIERIINKVLRKNPDERYQTIKGLMVDLKDVQKELEFQNKLEKTIEPSAGNQQTQILKATTVDEYKQTTNITTESKNSRWIYGIAAIGLAAVVIFAGWYFLAGNLFSKDLPFAKIRTEELLTTDGIYSLALSDDDKLIAFVKSGEADLTGKGLLVVRQIGSGAENIIYEKEEKKAFFYVETFSPDGDYIYFIEQAAGGIPDLYRIPSLGGTPRKIVEGGIDRVSISPDGKKIAYRKSDDSGANAHVYIANADGSDPEKILNNKDINANLIYPGNWSPDGTRLALFILREEKRSGDAEKEMRRLTAVFDINDLKGDRKERLEIVHNGEWAAFSTPRWTPDGKGLILRASKRESPRKTEIWHISYPEGKVRPITDGTIRYDSARVSADGKSLLAVTSINPTSFWSLGLDAKRAQINQLRSDNKTVDGYSLSRPADGRLYYYKLLKDGNAIHSMNENGGDEKELFTIPGAMDQFMVSPDGKFVVVEIFSGTTRSWRLHRINTDGSNKVELTKVKNGGDYNLQVTADGMIFFNRRYNDSKKPSMIMKVPLKGGNAEKVEGLEPSDHDKNARLSPDGQFLAYLADIKDKTLGESKTYIRVVKYADGQAGEKILEKDAPSVARLRWTSESDALIFEKDREQGNLYKLKLSDQTETKISDFNQNTDTGAFVLSEDGKRILVFRVSLIDTIVRITDAGADN